MDTWKNGTSGILAAFTADLAELAERVRASVVEVRTERHGGGAGTIWDADGIVVTNHHVAPRETAEVRLADGRTSVARTIARDVDNDLAVLRIDARGLPAVAIGDARKLRPGELVVAVGHPYGVTGAVSIGVVSAALSSGFSPDSRGARTRRDRELVRADILLGPGNSGGPLVDARGRVVGLNSMVAGGLALAVPSHLAEALIRGGSVERPKLGIVLRDVEVSPALAAVAGLSSRRVALIVDVAEAGPAARAGLLTGDVLTCLDGQTIQSANDVVRALSAASDGSLRLRILRGGLPLELSVQLAASEARRAA